MLGRKNKGWFDPDKAAKPDSKTRAAIKGIQAAELARHRIYEMTEDRSNEYLYDPVAGKWRTHKELSATRTAPWFMAWNSKTRVVTSKSGWTKEESLIASKYLLADAKDINLPPMPGV